MNPLYQVHIGLSNICNMQCLHCYSKNDRKLLHGIVSMPREKWLKIISEAKELGCFKFVIVYGEPLLANNLFPFLRDALSEEMDIEISTNGSIMNYSIAKKLWEIGVKKIQVSIDFADRERHDRYRGHSGAFDKAVNCIKILKKFPFRVKITSTILSSDVSDYENLLKLHKDLHTDMLYILPRRISTYIKKNDALLCKRNETILKFIEKNKKYSILCHDPHLFELAGGEHYEECYVGNIVHIDPLGNCRPCPLWDYVLGNVFEKKLINIWSNFDVSKFKKNISHKLCYAQTVCKK